MRASHIKAESTEYIKLYPGTKECLMDAFYVRSNISPKDDMAHDADYIIAVSYTHLTLPTIA